MNRFLALCILLIIYSVSTFAADLGTTAPNITLSGDKSLSGFSGKVVFVDFWASWCIPCRKSIPWLNELAARYSPEDLAVVAVNLDTEEGAATQLSKVLSKSVFKAVDPEGKVAKAYDLKNMPSSFIIGRDGKILRIYEGFDEDDKEKLFADIDHIVHVEKGDPKPDA